ncbi:hypothetical protein LTR85_004668 [Meristemomyces frigidus]|nr:hypothetical protein LTR85_004668 [Meristemomyces frigidus]
MAVDLYGRTSNLLTPDIGTIQVRRTLAREGVNAGISMMAEKLDQLRLSTAEGEETHAQKRKRSLEEEKEVNELAERIKKLRYDEALPEGLWELLDEVQKKRKKMIRISPVDRWNVTEPTQRPQARSPQRKVWDIQGWLNDENGKKYPVFRLGVNFTKTKWKACGDKHGQWPEDGQLVSPKTVPSVDQMSVVEYEEYQRRVHHVERDWEDELDPDTMTPFYPGILKMYGRRQVP